MRKEGDRAIDDCDQAASGLGFNSREGKGEEKQMERAEAGVGRRK